MKQYENKKNKILVGATCFFFGVFLVNCAMLIHWYLQYLGQEKLSRQLAGEYDSKDKWEQLRQEEDAVLDVQPDQAQAMKTINRDYVGWIAVEGTDIDYPVVYRDNSFYLTHDFYGEKSRHGTVFLDVGCETGDKYLLLHGHNMKDGTMFADLKEFRKDDFGKAGGRIFLEMNGVCREYETFCVALIDLTGEDFFHYEKFPESLQGISEYLSGLKSNALWYDENAFETWSFETSHMIVLSTCEYGTADQRLIVVARYVDDREESENATE